MANLLDLPWEDLICKKILIFLSVSDLCRLHRVSKYFSLLLDTYFGLCRKIDLSVSGRKNTFLSKNFVQLTNHCEHLRELNLNECKRWVNDDILIPVLEKNKYLKNIDISGCLAVTNGCIRKLALSCRFLEEIALAECRWLASDALLVIGLECCYLKKIILRGCWNINNESLSIIFRNNISIYHVDIASCYGIDGHSISVLAENCLNLQYLDIKGCWRVGNDAIFRLREYCKELRILKVKECRDIDERSLSMLRLRGVDIDIPKPPDYHRPFLPFGYDRIQNNAPSINLQI